MRGQGVAILRRVAAVVALSALFSVAAAQAAEVATPSPARADDDPLREILDATHRDGLDGILKRRILRVLVVPSRTDYFTDRGKQYGIAYESALEFERYLNRRYGKRLRPINVVIVPVTRDRLIPLLEEGKAELAIASITVTPEREARIDFSATVHEPVSEVVVSRKGLPPLNVLGDIAGRRFFVRQSSSYWDSLLTVNGHLATTGLKPIKLLKAEEYLEDEDILEMVNAGLVDNTVVDDYKALLWGEILPDINVQHAIRVRSGGRIAWGIRKGMPKFRAAVDSFVRTHRVGTLFGNVLADRYYGDNRWARRATGAEELARYHAVVDIFRKYGAQYSFDPLLLTAQGFQESGLDQRQRSHRGAVGVMQVLPSTGRAMKVGDIRQLEPNIHAGVKYLAQLRDNYFAGETITPLDRALLSLAAYNAGPTAIGRARREAARRKLDPNRWFDHVERVVAERIGRETVTYVADIAKYYVAYRLVDERERAMAGE
jgi:membrane-bound lytic murein transglycosylase MltF